jgi:anti-sigma regulatory factor (Ser/Thr protein kinase)
MTSVARPAPRRLAAFAVPSEPGNERLALARVAEAVAASGLPPARLERLKTAVAEATMNAIEHGNRGRPEVPVDVEVTQEGDDIVVAITDLGGEHAPPGPAEEPDLLLKLEGEQQARGWGLFLIRNMVDAMQVRTDGPRRTIQLTMRGGATPVPHSGGLEGGGHEGSGHEEEL